MSWVDGFLFCVSSLVFRVKDFVFRVSCFVLRVSFFGFLVPGLVPDPWFQVSVSGFRFRLTWFRCRVRVSGPVFRVPLVGVRVPSLKKVAGCRFRVRTSGFGCRVSGFGQLGVDSEEQRVPVWTRYEDHCGTCRTVKAIKARFWPWLSGKITSNVVNCSLSTRKRQELEQLGAESDEQDVSVSKE